MLIIVFLPANLGFRKGGYRILQRREARQPFEDPSAISESSEVAIPRRRFDRPKIEVHVMRSNNKWSDLEGPSCRRFAIYLPTQQKNGAVVENFDTVKDFTLKLLSAYFGGATSYSAEGVFQGAKGLPRMEEIRMLECFCELEAWQKFGQYLLILLGVLAQVLNQESIGCALDGRMIFVPPLARPLPNPFEADAINLKRLVESIAN